MSLHSNFNKEKCWSCIFYAGNRKIKSFLTKSIITDSYGMCTCKKCSDSGKKVSENNCCSKWQIDPLTHQCQVDEANKKAEIESRAEAERQKREIEHQQWQAEMRQRDAEREMERERRRLEEERKKLEYERWYASLTPEEKESENKKIAREKQLKEERLQEEIRQAEIQRKYEEEARQIKNKKIKKGLLAGGVSLVGVIAIAVASVCIFNVVKEKQVEEAFKNSDTGKLLALIQKETGGKDEFYFTVDRDEGCKAYFGFEYKKNGWTDLYNQTRDFRVYCKFTPRSEDHYKSSTGFCFFNLNGSENANSKYLNGKGASFNASATYDTNSQVITQYQSVSYSSTSKQISYGGSYYTYENWKSTYNEYTDEWKDRGFTACNLVNTLVEQYCIAAFSLSFWR